MAKNTHSQQVITGTSDSYTMHEISDPSPPVIVTRAVLGGELQLAGKDSSELSESERQSSEHSKSSPLEPAQTTESPSDPMETGREGSTARTTGGGGRRTVKQQSGSARGRRANVRAAGFEDDDDFD